MHLNLKCILLGSDFHNPVFVIAAFKVRPLFHKMRLLNWNCISSLIEFGFIRCRLFYHRCIYLRKYGTYCTNGITAYIKTYNEFNCHTERINFAIQYVKTRRLIHEIVSRYSLTESFMIAEHPHGWVSDIFVLNSYVTRRKFPSTLPSEKKTDAFFICCSNYSLMNALRSFN